MLQSSLFGLAPASNALVGQDGTTFEANELFAAFLGPTSGKHLADFGIVAFVNDGGRRSRRRRPDTGGSNIFLTVRPT